MRILTNDPSFTAWGWAVIEIKNGATKVLQVGCLKTEPENKLRRIRKSDDTTRRIGELAHALMSLIQEYQVSFILCESVHGSQNASAAVMMGATAGIMQTISVAQGLPIEWYSEAEAKKTLSGKRSLTKQATIKAIKDLYTLEWPEAKYKQEAVADAMAIFHAGMISSEILRYHKLQEQPQPKVFKRTK